MVNGEIERLFGYRREELLGRLGRDPAARKVARQARQTARRLHARIPAPATSECGATFSDGARTAANIPIEVGLNPIRVGERASLVLCAIVDISERKRLERLQDEFVSTVSHELRTPMTSIAGSLGLLSPAARAVPVACRPCICIEIAHANCQRLVRLVNDILDIKKLESGQMTFHFQRCDARALLEQAIEANRGFADELRRAHSAGCAGGAPSTSRSTPTVSCRSSPICSRMRSNSRRAGDEVVVSIEAMATMCASRCATMVPASRPNSSRAFSRNSRRPIRDGQQRRHRPWAEHRAANRHAHARARSASTMRPAAARSSTSIFPRPII